MKVNLQVSLSQSGGKRGESSSMTDSKGSKKKAVSSDCTKLMVRNVAFECSRSELRQVGTEERVYCKKPKMMLQLFGAFGAIKSVRMPKKFDHR